MFYRHKDTGETKWELDEEEEEETASTEDTIKILSSNEADADRKIFVSSDMKQTTEIEKRIFTRLKLVLKQLNEEIDDTSVDTLAKSVTLHFGPHISADTRQMVGHLLGSLQDIRHEISDAVVLKNLDIETLWNQYEQFIRRRMPVRSLRYCITLSYSHSRQIRFPDRNFRLRREHSEKFLSSRRSMYNVQNRGSSSETIG